MNKENLRAEQQYFCASPAANWTLMPSLGCELLAQSLDWEYLHLERSYYSAKSRHITLASER